MTRHRLVLADTDIVERLRHVLIYGDQEQAITAMEVAADEIEKLKRTIKYGEQLIYESGLRLGEMSRACAELRTENDIMRRHLNLHPDKPLGNELRAEVARLTAAMKDLRERAVEEGIHHFVNRIDTALEPSHE